MRLILGTYLLSLAIQHPVVVFGQDKRCEFGVSLPLFAKYPFGSHEDVFNAKLGVIGISAALRIAGADEQSMSLLQVISFQTDDIRYGLSSNSRLGIQFNSLEINPNILIPSKWLNIHYVVGMGALVSLGNVVRISASDNNIGVDVDDIGHQLDQIRRVAVPFVNIGALYSYHNHIKIQACLQQSFLSFNDPESTFTYTDNQVTRTVIASYQPLYAGVRFYYFF
jgi:hypothetical protein